MFVTVSKVRDRRAQLQQLHNRIRPHVVLFLYICIRTYNFFNSFGLSVYRYARKQSFDHKHLTLTPAGAESNLNANANLF